MTEKNDTKGELTARIAKLGVILSLNIIILAGCAAREPFFYRVEKHNPGIGVDYTVPSGKLLVIENISVYSDTRRGQMARPATLRIRPPGETAINALNIQYVSIPLTPVAGGTAVLLHEGEVQFDFVTANLTTRLYAKENYELLIHVPGIIDAADGSITGGGMSISGYLIPANSEYLSP